MKKTKSRLGRRRFIGKGLAVGMGAVAGAAPLDAFPSVRNTARRSVKWHAIVDVVVVGSGAAGLPAAIRARDQGAAVLVIEENFDVGGHAMISGGSVSLGGGTSLQSKYGIEDSADRVYLENTRPDHPMTRYNDREVVRSFADHNVEVFDFLLANGVRFADEAPTNVIPAEGTLTPRRQDCVRWSDNLQETINGTGGSGLMRALEKSARAKGVEIRLQHRMLRFVREDAPGGRVLGIVALDLQSKREVFLGARRAVIACTGGSSNNVFIRTIFDPRLTEEYQVGCAPYSRQTGDTEQQGMAIGAALGSTSNARNEAFYGMQKTMYIGCRYGFAQWNPDSPVFHVAGATGLSVSNYQDVILVNTLGHRFYNETAPYSHTSPDGRGGVAIYDYFAAAMSSAVTQVNGVTTRVGGPIWAVFDADALKRERWNPVAPNVDIANGYFFTAATLAELAQSLSRNPYQKIPMSPAQLQDSITRYNSFVELGADPDFGKPAPQYKIQSPPFYAAWATPILHDTYAGLRVNGKWQVIDVFGKVIPGFYCAGESASGITLHGLSRCIVGGYVAATNAMIEPAANVRNSSVNTPT